MSIDVPAKINTKENPVMMAVSDRRWAIHDPPIFVMSPRDQIVRASRIKTSRARNFGIAPEAAAQKTIASAAVDAACGVKPKK